MSSPDPLWIRSQQICSTEGTAYYKVKRRIRAQAADTEELNATFIMKEVVLNMMSHGDLALDKSLDQEIKVLQWLRAPGVPAYVASFDEDQRAATPTRHRQLVLRLNAPPRSTLHSLLSLIEGGWRPTASEAEHIASQLLRTIAHAHAFLPPYAHGAISPRSILVAMAPDGRLTAWLVDWGASGSDDPAPYGPAEDLQALGRVLEYIITQGDPAARPQPAGRLGALVRDLTAGRWPGQDAALAFLTSRGLWSGRSGGISGLLSRIDSGGSGIGKWLRRQIAGVSGVGAEEAGWVGWCEADVETVLRRLPGADSDGGGRVTVRVKELREGIETTVTVKVAAKGLTREEASLSGLLGSPGALILCDIVILLTAILLAMIWTSAGFKFFISLKLAAALEAGFIILFAMIIPAAPLSLLIERMDKWGIADSPKAGVFAWKLLSATLEINPAALTVALRQPGDAGPGEPPATIRRDEALAPRPVAAAGWAGALGAADVAVGLRGGGERRLGLAVGREEADWIAALVAAMWRDF
jgi:hypothetical protein